MKFYHRTTKENARAVIKGGFKDRTGNYLTTCLHTGVWISREPLDVNEGAKGDALFELNVPERVVRPYEWIEEGKPYREFLVPAAVLNAYKKRILRDEPVPLAARFKRRCK